MVAISTVEHRLGVERTTHIIGALSNHIELLQQGILLNELLDESDVTSQKERRYFSQNQLCKLLHGLRPSDKKLSKYAGAFDEIIAVNQELIEKQSQWFKQVNNMEEGSNNEPVDPYRISQLVKRRIGIAGKFHVSVEELNDISRSVFLARRALHDVIGGAAQNKSDEKRRRKRFFRNVWDEIRARKVGPDNNQAQTQTAENLLEFNASNENIATIPYRTLQSRTSAIEICDQAATLCDALDQQGQTENKARQYASLQDRLKQIRAVAYHQPEFIDRANFHPLLESLFKLNKNHRQLAISIVHTMDALVDAEPRIFDDWHYAFNRINSLVAGKGVGQNTDISLLLKDKLGRWTAVASDGDYSRHRITQAAIPEAPKQD